MWFNNLHDHWYQNRLNQETRGTLMNLLRHNHPRVIYHEADMSTYNRNAYTYEPLAKEMGIDLDQLDYGPIVVIMHDQRGDALRSEKGTLSLLSSVDKNIHHKEYKIYGSDKPLCNIDVEIEAVNEFKLYNPWDDYEYYRPEKDEINHEKRNQKTVSAKVINKEGVMSTPIIRSKMEQQTSTGARNVINPSSTQLSRPVEPEKTFFEMIQRRRRRRR